MGKINMQKVLIGGLIAGVVLNVVDSVLFGVVLKDQMAAAMTSINRPATSIARRVLPAPPVPVSVTSRFAGTSSMSWAISCSRPISRRASGTARPRCRRRDGWPPAVAARVAEDWTTSLWSPPRGADERIGLRR